MERMFSNIEGKFLLYYRQLFSIAEIEQSRTLQWVFGATLLSYFVTFYGWIGTSALTVEGYIDNSFRCWPWFPSCGEWTFLHSLPHGYSQTILYMIFFAMMLAIVYFMAQRAWVKAHALLAILFLWKFVAMFLLTMLARGNYDYYHIIFSFVLLFLPYKLFFLQFSVVFLYFLAATIKIHEGWILGTYFTSLKTGLPIFSNAVAPLITNIVIFMQIVGAWFLMSGRQFLQRAALVYFVFFHLYSGILVEYHYPVTVLPTLLILFGPWYEKQSPPLNKKSIAGWVLAAFLLACQSIAIIIPGDVKLTLEGNDYGLYMFEANHQCIMSYTIFDRNGDIVGSSTAESALSRNRCSPYGMWFTLKELCRRTDTIDRITWTEDHSINGRPFYRIVDVPNVCVLEYNSLGHNEWIKTPEEGAPLIGYPVQNFYN